VPYCAPTEDPETHHKYYNCNEFGLNSTIIFFYFLFCCYFFSAALQIKYGLTEMRGKGFLMFRPRNFPNGWLVKGYFMIPFLLELKTIIDWTFTKTAIGLFSWLRLANAHKMIFCAKCSNIKKVNRPVGKPSSLHMKIFQGGTCLIFMMGLIAIPLLFFSTFNPIAAPNKVINSQAKVNLRLSSQKSQASKIFTLYENVNVQELR